jgi:hypothetical protein
MNILGDIFYIYTPMMIILNTIVIENDELNRREYNFMSSIIFFILVFVYFSYDYSVVY